MNDHARREFLHSLQALFSSTVPVTTSHTSWQAFAAHSCPKISPHQTPGQTVMLAADVLWHAHDGNNEWATIPPLPTLRLHNGQRARVQARTCAWTKQELRRFRTACLGAYPWVVHLCHAALAAHHFWKSEPQAWQTLAQTTMAFDVEAYREALIDLSTCLDLLRDLQVVKKELLLGD